MNNKWMKLTLMFVSIIFLFAPDLLFSEVPDKTVLDSLLPELFILILIMVTAGFLRSSFKILFMLK